MDIDSVPIIINLQLANGRTGLRFCYAAANLLSIDRVNAKYTELDAMTEDDEFLSEVVEEWEGRLHEAGYSVHWNAGDVVVFDVRGLSIEELDQFHEVTENW